MFTTTMKLIDAYTWGLARRREGHIIFTVRFEETLIELNVLQY